MINDKRDEVIKKKGNIIMTPNGGRRNNIKVKKYLHY